MTDGWFRTGDIGALVKRLLHVLAKKSLIVLSSERSASEEVEEVLGRLLIRRDLRWECKRRRSSEA